MADMQPNLEINTELSGRAALNMDQSTPMAVLADRESAYRMVVLGTMYLNLYLTISNSLIINVALKSINNWW